MVTCAVPYLGWVPELDFKYRRAKSLIILVVFHLCSGEQEVIVLAWSRGDATSHPVPQAVANKSHQTGVSEQEMPAARKDG